MDTCRLLTEQLGVLTLALDDPGTDLKAMLDVLSDDLVAAVPSFLGLTMTLILDDGAIALTTVDGDVTRAAGARIELALAMPRAEDDARLVCYARDSGSFGALAADVGLVGHSSQHVVRGGGRLSSEPVTAPATAPGITGLDGFAVINRAIGVLISRGDSPAQAHDELRRRAAAGPNTLPEAAEQILRTTNIG